MSQFDHIATAQQGTRDSGQPTPEELETINARLALVPQRAEDLFVFPFVISNTDVDSYGTWMDVSSLRRFSEQANTGRGVPYLRHHDVYSDERGRVFKGEIREQPVTAGAGAALTARDLLHPAASRSVLVEHAYLLRGVVLNGLANDDLIRQIEAGVSASHSIGFSVYSMAAPGSWMECDVCGLDLIARDADGEYLCPHMPGVPCMAAHDGAEHQVTATARVHNAVQREASGVYLGATPGAYTLAQRGHELFRSGRVSAADATRLEDVLQLQRGVVTLGRPTGVHSLPARVGARVPESRTGGHMKDETQAPDVAERVAALLSGESGMAALVELSDQQLAADPISFLYNTLTAEVAEARSDTEAWQQRHEELLVAVRGRIGLEQDRDLLEGLDALLARAAVADDVREELVAELLRQMTRAGLTFTEEHQRRLAAGLSAEELRAQATMYRESANRLYPPGRVTPEPTERRSTPMARVPASSYQG